MNRKISTDAWTLNRPLNVFASTNWRPGARELGAHQHRDQAADEQEHERVDRVLDPDHLVIGVDPEVVLPRVRAVQRVVLGPRRLARRPVEPVVERAQTDQEEERRREHRDQQDRVGVDEVRRRCRGRTSIRISQLRTNENTTPSSRNRKARARLGLRKRGDHGYLWVTVDRYWTRALRSAGLIFLPKSCGMMPFWKPFSTKAPGSTIDCLMNAASLSRGTCRGPARWCRVAPASASVWHAAAGVGGEDLLAGRDARAATRRRRRRPRRRGGAGLRHLGQPGVEVCRRQDVRRLAHERVAEPAELGADDRVGAGFGSA